MFLPIHDGLPMRHLRRPWVTRGLMATCVIVWVLMASGLVPVGETWIVAGFGLIPGVLFGTVALPEGLPFVSPPFTLLTSIFIHGGFAHLVGNMLFLWVFGDNVEDAMGHGRFLAFFLACGAAAGLAHAGLAPDSERPLIGASGAVSGIVAAYLILHPRVQLWGLFLKGIPLRLRASWVLGAWILLQFGSAILGLDDSVGWWAHVGGILAGAALIPILRRPGVVLLDRNL